MTQRAQQLGTRPRRDCIAGQPRGRNRLLRQGASAAHVRQKPLAARQGHQRVGAPGIVVGRGIRERFAGQRLRPAIIALGTRDFGQLRQGAADALRVILGGKGAACLFVASDCRRQLAQPVQDNPRIQHEFRPLAQGRGR